MVEWYKEVNLLALMKEQAVPLPVCLLLEDRHTQQLSSHNDTSGQTQSPCVLSSLSSVPRVCDCWTFLMVGSVCC